MTLKIKIKAIKRINTSIESLQEVRRCFLMLLDESHYLFHAKEIVGAIEKLTTWREGIKKELIEMKDES